MDLDSMGNYKIYKTAVLWKEATFPNHLVFLLIHLRFLGEFFPPLQSRFLDGWRMIDRIAGSCYSKWGGISSQLALLTGGIDDIIEWEIPLPCLGLATVSFSLQQYLVCVSKQGKCLLEFPKLCLLDRVWKPVARLYQDEGGCFKCIQT